MKKKDAEAQALERCRGAKKEAEAKEAQAKKEAVGQERSRGKRRCARRRRSLLRTLRLAPLPRPPSKSIASSTSSREKIVAFEDFSAGCDRRLSSKMEYERISGSRHDFRQARAVVEAGRQWLLHARVHHGAARRLHAGARYPFAADVQRMGTSLQTVTRRAAEPAGNSELLRADRSTQLFPHSWRIPRPEAQGSVQVILRQASVSTPAQ